MEAMNTVAHCPALPAGLIRRKDASASERIDRTSAEATWLTSLNWPHPLQLCASSGHALLTEEAEIWAGAEVREVREYGFDLSVG